ncbi:hypothetical protein G3I01_12170 [Gramella sp. MT6]|uniref:hypothetical protein n=1 Tax=Gramella sp. MT6 TaxID=2705471 RepID=UPI001C5E8FCC|nr:hypothetical protein [Gramella sp. MT6]QYA26227.1 hypothetical protein G3I01_12170 [Gramella sp. MT6]
MYTDFSGARSFEFGLNAGLGYDLTKSTQIEGRTFQTLNNYSTDNAFQPVQLTPMQPISLGFKTKI